MSYPLSWLKVHCDRRFASAIVLPLALTLMLGGCADRTTSSTPTASTTAQAEPTGTSQPAPQGETLHIAVIPAQSSKQQAEQLQALAAYLEKSLGHKFDLQVQKDYETAIDLLVTGKVEIAYLGPLAYVKARERNSQLEPIVAPITKATGRPWHTSLILASTAAGIQQPGDLKGKRFGFVSKSSTTGYLVPLVELFEQQNIQPDRDFQDVKFLGSHDKSIAALIAGKVDAVAVEQEAFNKAKAAGQLKSANYQKIWESQPLPTAPIVVSTKLPPATIAALKKALIDAPEGVVAVSGIESAGYTLVSDADYEPIRQLQASLTAKTKPAK